MYDYHIHTQFSFDSLIKGEDLMKKAIELGYKEIAITEHLDLLPLEAKQHGIPSLKKYRDYCRDLQERYPQITLHCGLEIGDYHKTKDYAAALISGFDFFPILGSVHILSDDTNVAIPLKNPLSIDQVNDYYHQNLELVQNCEIDILGHLGVYKRYYDEPIDESLFYPIIKEIFSTIIKRKIYLEVNLSSLSKPYGQIIPEPEMLNVYASMGGDLVCIGSDTHRLKNFEDNRQIIQKYNIPATRVQKRR